MTAYWRRVIEPRAGDPRHAGGRHRLPRGPARRRRPARGVRRPPRRGAWRDGALVVDRPYESTVELAGRGLLLVPVAFAWPQLWAMIDPPWQPAVVYAPRGVATLWEPAEQAPDALADLLGRRRAGILAALPPPPRSSPAASPPAPPASPSTSPSSAAPAWSTPAARAARSATPAPGRRRARGSAATDESRARPSSTGITPSPQEAVMPKAITPNLWFDNQVSRPPSSTARSSRTRGSST